MAPCIGVSFSPPAVLRRSCRTVADPLRVHDGGRLQLQVVQSSWCLEPADLDSSSNEFPKSSITLIIDCTSLTKALCTLADWSWCRCWGGVLQRPALHRYLYLCPFHLFYRLALRLPASTANLYLLALTRVRRECIILLSTLLRETVALQSEGSLDVQLVNCR